MIDTKIKNKFDDLIYSLNVKYNLFYNNYQYKNSYFKGDERYVNIQKQLSEEIQTCENDLKEILKIFIHQYFENIKIIAYDSRSLCVAEGKENIGNLLISNSTEEELKKITEEIKNNFEFNIKIDLFENLPDDVKAQFTF